MPVFLRTMGGAAQKKPRKKKTAESERQTTKAAELEGMVLGPETPGEVSIEGAEPLMEPINSVVQPAQSPDSKA